MITFSVLCNGSADNMLPRNNILRRAIKIKIPHMTVEVLRSGGG